jgi:membrane fusion protein (multidrug efflux system)
MNRKKTVKRIYNVVIVTLLVLAIVYIASRFFHPGNVEWTDDAQVHRLVTPVNTRVQGFIKEIRFTDYQHVHAGDTLVIIEDAEYRLQLAQAEAGVKGQQWGSAAISAGINTTESNVNVAAAGERVAGSGTQMAQAGSEIASAGIADAKAGLDNAKKDFDRYAALLARGSVTQQQFDQVRTSYDQARARYDQAVARHRQAQASQAQASASRSQAAATRQATAAVSREQRQHLRQSGASVSVEQAKLNLARLNLSYTVIVAPCDGYMGRKNIHEGQLVQSGEELAKIVDQTSVWVVANYRESQLKHIKVGSAVSFTADAVSGVKFNGHVAAISYATGSAYSSVPVDNAAGNFVKVEQRVPVFITLDAGDNKKNALKLLRAGFNVETEVKY